LPRFFSPFGDRGDRFGSIFEKTIGALFPALMRTVTAPNAYFLYARGTWGIHVEAGVADHGASACYAR